VGVGVCLFISHPFTAKISTSGCMYVCMYL
jgi:hypothetical protein